MSNETIPISASRLKTFSSCSWLYWSKYHLKLPDESNDGARRGSVVHKLFECLLNPRHRKYYDWIIENKYAFSNPVLALFLNKQKSINGLVNEFDDKGFNNDQMIEEMILVGLQLDFFCEGGKLQKAETFFDYTNQDPVYRIVGYIDRLATYKNDSLLKITDYKTSSKKFDGKDEEFNMQNYIYSLYGKRVRRMDTFLEFLFLRFPEEPILHAPMLSEEQLIGFEYYLAEINAKLLEFNEQDALSNLAAKKGYPPKEDGFSGLLLCGYGKYKGHIKKATGEPYWVCSCKFSQDYYVLLDETGKIRQSSLNPEDLQGKLKTGWKIEPRFYSGCPAFCNPDGTLKNPN